MAARNQHADLPSAPPIDAPRAPAGAPRWVLTRKQQVGLPVLVLIAVLGLFGTFGERTSTIRAATNSLAVTVSYPARLRYRQTARMQIAVTNRTSRALDTVRVALDTAYLSRFVGVRVDPEPSAASIVVLPAMAPGETQLVSVELTGNRYWRHPASLGVARGEERALLHFSSFVFP